MSEQTSSSARITVVFPVYRAMDTVAGLVGAIGRQQPPAAADPAEWLRVIFIDNASPDATLEVLEAALATADLPFDVQVVRNDENIGLARSFNRALGMVTTDFVLTCHADCRFATDDYLAEAVRLLDENPDVAVVSGQSLADVSAGLSQVEKVYLAANLMDIFPEDGADLVSLGFAEGRCDAFRMEALRAVGFYDTTLRRAGEDQVMSARLRDLGYRVCKAPTLPYYLSVSSDQDSLLKLVRHAELFGRVTPYLLLANRGTVAGIAGTAAGRNRTERTMLRGLQVLGAAGWLALGASVGVRRARVPAAAIVVGTSAAKAALMARYVRHLEFEAGDLGALMAMQVPLDVAYATGGAKGLWRMLRPSQDGTV